MSDTPTRMNVQQAHGRPVRSKTARIPALRITEEVSRSADGAEIGRSDDQPIEIGNSTAAGGQVAVRKIRRYEHGSAVI